MNVDESAGDPLATIGQRIAARVVDWLLLMAIWLLLGGATSEQLDDGTIIFERWAILTWIAIVVIYEATLVAFRGRTLGKQLIGIELVSLKDGGRLSFAASLTRVMPVTFAIVLLSRFFPIAMVFLYFSAAFMENSRGVLDLISGSVVIQTKGRL